MKLEGRIAVVTGAASGIGRAIARRFAAEGAIVVVGDVRESPIKGGEKTVDLIRETGAVCEFKPMDVSVWSDVDRVVSETVARHGSLDIMVNNAAVYAGTALLDTQEEDWDRVMAVNAKGVFFGCKRAVQQMLTQAVRNEARGRIVNISSQHGMISCPGDIAYGVGKSAVVYMTRQIAADYADQHIVCNAVAPGKILTGRTDAIDDASLSYSNARTPMSRLGKPADVASAVTFLASDDATYMTGVNLMVDGGWMAA